MIFSLAYLTGLCRPYTFVVDEGFAVLRCGLEDEGESDWEAGFEIRGRTHGLRKRDCALMYIFLFFWLAMNKLDIDFQR